MIGRTGLRRRRSPHNPSPMTGCFCISARSPGSSGPDFKRIASGMPTLPTSWRYPPRCSAAISSSGRPRCAPNAPPKLGHPLAVAHGVAIARLDGQPQAQDHRIGTVEVVGESFQTNERTHAGLELVPVEGLGQEVVGAGVDALDPIGALGKAGDEHDRDQPRLPVVLEAAAQLEAVHPGHHHVGEHRDRAAPAGRGRALPFRLSLRRTS